MLAVEMFNVDSPYTTLIIFQFKSPKDIIQVFEYEARFKGMSLAASCRTQGTHASSYDGEPLPWKLEDKFATTASPPTSSSSPKET